MRHKRDHVVAIVQWWTLTVLVLTLQIAVTYSTEKLSNTTLQSTQTSVISQTTTSTVPDNTPELRQCDYRSNCTLNEICLNGQCVCQAGYARNAKDECEERNCANEFGLCEKHDLNRQCKSSIPFIGFSECKCRKGYWEDPLTLVCRPICQIDKPGICELKDGDNTVCNVYRCQCRSGYRRNHTGHCEPFRCSIHAHCWTEGDYYRTCDNGTCTCPYEIDPITDRCEFQIDSLFKWRYYHSWQAEKILLATVIIVPIVFYYCVLQNYRKARSTFVALNGPGPVGLDKLQPSTVHSIADHKQQVYSDQMEPIGQLGKTGFNKALRPKQNKDQFKYQRFV